jgi:acyl-CoA thioesterase-1
MSNKTFVLFQGDSITDCGRDRENQSSLGNGYAMMASSFYCASHPDKNIKFINKGISGNRVRDLKARWQEDCLSLKPDVISIFIGINDCWRRYDRNDPTTAEEFEKDYRIILNQIKENLNSQIILIEPFVLPYPEDRIKWREDLDPKINVVRKLAREFKTRFIPMDGIFAQACTHKEPSYWSEDGVHPTSPGHALIAKAWLQTLESMNV